MASLSIPVQRARGYISVARTDSLVRNSIYMMLSTVVTAGLGYVFWIVTAHFFTSAQVGIASAVISLCSTVSLLTYLGSWATLIERLHAYEQSRKWTSVLTRICLGTAALTMVVAAVAVPVLAHSKNYGSFFSATSAVVLAVLGAAAWTLVNLFSAAFIAARRADGLLSIQTLVSVIKLLMIVPVIVVGSGSLGLVGAWVISALVGVAVGALWLLPRLGLYRRPSSLASHRLTQGRSPEYWTGQLTQPVFRPAWTEPRHRQTSRSATFSIGRMAGQHLTSVGGAVTPLVLPTLVVLRLGVAPNAYFYITWMVGGVFFMVSPSISSALFAESVREKDGLKNVVTKAFRVSMTLLIPAMVVVIAAGRLILDIFGSGYAQAGYWLLVVLALSAVPDAVSNIAVAVFRVTNRIHYSAVLNIGILITTLAGAWFLMPVLGILGVGIAWLAAQILGAIASFPAYTGLRREAVV